jgi:hypothetical protein
MLQCIECGRDLIAIEDRDNWMCEECQIRLREEEQVIINEEPVHCCSYIDMPGD